MAYCLYQNKGPQIATMYSFDGKHKRKPVVSLGGVSKKVSLRNGAFYDKGMFLNMG